MDDSSESDYEVEAYVKPDRIVESINDERADLLGNFDDKKREEIFSGTYQEEELGEDDVSETYQSEESEQCTESESEQENDSIQENINGENTKEEINQDGKHNEQAQEDTVPSNENNDSDSKPKTSLTKEQLTRLRRGTAKADRYVLYVTNLNFETTPGILKDYFNTVGTVRSIRIPKRKRGGFGFVEMDDLDSYQRGFELHNTELMGRCIKVQYSEAGKKKSANKKNILKQKNRKLAEMRNERKCFTKSGKYYDKALKKEKASELMARKRWRKPKVINKKMD